MYSEGMAHLFCTPRCKLIDRWTRMMQMYAALQLRCVGQSVCALCFSCAEEHPVTLQCATLDFDTIGDTAVSLLRAVLWSATYFCLARDVDICRFRKGQADSKLFHTCRAQSPRPYFPRRHQPRRYPVRHPYHRRQHAWVAWVAVCGGMGA